MRIEVTIMNNENLNISLQLFSCSYELGIAVGHLTLSLCCSTIFVICLSYEVVVHFSAGVRIWSWCANFRKYCWCANSYTSVRKKNIVHFFSSGHWYAKSHISQNCEIFAHPVKIHPSKCGGGVIRAKEIIRRNLYKLVSSKYAIKFR